MRRWGTGATEETYERRSEHAYPRIVPPRRPRRCGTTGAAAQIDTARPALHTARMSVFLNESQQVPAPSLGEQELADSALTLLAQSNLWPSLHLGPAGLETALDRPWTLYWSTRL